MGDLLDTHQTTGIQTVTAVTSHAVKCLKLAVSVFRQMILLERLADFRRIHFLQWLEIREEVRSLFVRAFGCQATTLRGLGGDLEHGRKTRELGLVLVPGSIVTVDAAGLNKQGLALDRITLEQHLLGDRLLFETKKESGEVGRFVPTKLKVRHAGGRVVLTRVFQKCHKRVALVFLRNVDQWDALNTTGLVHVMAGVAIERLVKLGPCILVALVCSTGNLGFQSGEISGDIG